ncbi:hypothetical protein Tco_0044881 [Tanacetum coccineum]
MANCLTTDGIKDAIFKKQENAGNKKRSNDQNKNRGRDDRNKRKNRKVLLLLTATEQCQGQRQYASQHPKCAKCNFHYFGNCPVCGRCNQVGHFTRYCTGRATNERPRPTFFECGDPNHFRRKPKGNESLPQAKIVCLEKIVQIPLANGENLEVHGKRLETDIREKDEKSSKNGQNQARNGKA